MRYPSFSSRFLICFAGWLSLSAILGAISTATHAQARMTQSHDVFRVIVFRHGVRSPTTEPKDLLKYANQPWPLWPVAAGQMTDHGLKAMHALGERYRRVLGIDAHGSVSCQSDNVVAIADTVERDQFSAQAFLHGLLPQCQARFSVRPDGLANSLFHFHVPETVSSSSKSEFPRSLYSRLSELQRILLGCSGVRCWDAARAKQVELLWSGKPEPDVFKLAGRLSENLMLEYVQGFPLNQVGWGRSDHASIGRIIALHNGYFAATKQPVAIAADAASNLMAHIIATLNHAAHRHDDVAPLASGQAQSVLLFGHDTNLAQLSGLLGASWHHPKQPDLYPPGGAVLFDLMKKRATWYVRVHAFLPTLEALRTGSLKSSAAMVDISLKLPQCHQRVLCPLEQFEAIMKQRIRTDRVDARLEPMVSVSAPLLHRSAPSSSTPLGLANPSLSSQ